MQSHDVALHRHDHLGDGGEGVHSQDSQRRRAINQEVIEAADGKFLYLLPQKLLGSRLGGYAFSAPTSHGDDGTIQTPGVVV